MGISVRRLGRSAARSIAAGALALATAAAQAVPFVSDGSDGAFAPLASTTIDLSSQGVDGVFNFTTIDIPEHVTVRFTTSASNPAVVFGATGDVNIAGTVVVSAAGRIGGPGGGEGGHGGNGDNSLPTDGTGPAPGAAGGLAIDPTDARFGTGGAGGGGGNARPGRVATSRTGPLVGAGGAVVAPQASLVGGSGGGGGSGGLFFGVDTSGGRGGGAGGGFQVSTAGTIALTGALMSDGAHGGTGFAIAGAPGGGGSGGSFELNAGTILLGPAATVRAIGGAGGGLSSESCTVTDPYRCSSFANGGLGYLTLDASTIDVAPDADLFAQPVGVSLPGFSPQTPFLPSSQTTSGAWTFDPIEVLPTAFGGFLGPSFWIDPEVAVGYDYAVDDARIASVELPFGFGDDVYEIWLRNPATGAFEPVQTLAAGTRLDLTGLDPFGTGVLGGGVDVLRVLGIELDELLDPGDPAAFPTGLTFLPTPGVDLSSVVAASLSMTPLTQSTGSGGGALVSAPGTLALSLLGLGGLRIARRAARVVTTRRPPPRSRAPRR